MAVIDIRGTHGSGKSWIVHQLLKRFHAVPDEVVKERARSGKEILGYVLSLGKGDTAYVVGTYANACGGCDNIRKADEVVSRVMKAAKIHRHVILEGILVAHTFPRYRNLADELFDYGYKFLFLNTPVAQCIARAKKRRLDRGNTKPLDLFHLKRDWFDIFERVRKQCEEAGLDTVIVPWVNPMPTVLEVINHA